MREEGRGLRVDSTRKTESLHTFGREGGPYCVRTDRDSAWRRTGPPSISRPLLVKPAVHTPTFYASLGSAESDVESPPLVPRHTPFHP
jgi:hypothetical protein